MQTECALMGRGGMSAEAAAIAREAQMRSEASEAARIAYVTQARTLRERRGSFIKMVVVSALVAAICIAPSWYSWCAWVFDLYGPRDLGCGRCGHADQSDQGARQARDGYDAHPRRCR